MKLWLASMKWPERLEPICVGSNKEKTLREAVRRLKEQYGTGPVERPMAMCSFPIVRNDIDMRKLPVV